MDRYLMSSSSSRLSETTAQWTATEQKKRDRFSADSSETNGQVKSRRLEEEEDHEPSEAGTSTEAFTVRERSPHACLRPL